MKITAPGFIRGDLGRTQVKSRTSTKKYSTEAKREPALEPTLYHRIMQQPFFEGLSPDQLRLFAQSAVEIEFEAGQWIFKEGRVADRFYLILEGKAVLESEAKGRSAGAIQTLGPGDNLGWNWLFPAPYFLFSARAVEPIKAILFYRAGGRGQGLADQPAGDELTEHIATVVIDNLKAFEQRLVTQVGALQR